MCSNEDFQSSLVVKLNDRMKSVYILAIISQIIYRWRSSFSLNIVWHECYDYISDCVKKNHWGYYMSTISTLVPIRDSVDPNPVTSDSAAVRGNLRSSSVSRNLLRWDRAPQATRVILTND